MVSVDDDKYQSQSTMKWRDPEVQNHEPKPRAQAEKCKYDLGVRRSQTSHLYGVSLVGLPGEEKRSFLLQCLT